MIFAISPAYFPFPRQFFCNSLPELDLTLLDSFHKILYCKCTGVFYLDFACCPCRKSVQEEPTMTQFSKQEKSWILYDVANSAFTMLVSTTIPIYFRSLAEQSVSEATASGIFDCGAHSGSTLSVFGSACGLPRNEKKDFLCLSYRGCHRSAAAFLCRQLDFLSHAVCFDPTVLQRLQHLL